MARGHLVSPVGLCTARIGIGEFVYVGSFNVLPECSCEPIIGMNFLLANSAIIDLQESNVSFSTENAVAMCQTDKPVVSPLRVVDEGVTLPPRLSVTVPVKNDIFSDYEVLADGNVGLIIEKGICMAGGLVNLRNRCADVPLTNFGSEAQHVAKGTAIATLHEYFQVANVCALDWDPLDSAPMGSVLESIDINSELSSPQRKHIVDQIKNFAECFSISSKVVRTPVTKHRIVVEENVRPAHQSPYRVAPKKNRSYKKTSTGNAERRCNTAIT